MPVAFVLIDADIGKVREILDQLRRTEGVVEAYTVAGPHDIVVKLQADKFEKVAEAVTRKIQLVEGVKNTLTLFAFE
ncbi:MAG: Lrp/AsnC family transcriptional regulator [Candidatus Hadarchaeum sp.]|uniref:Lrp/AsnC family transcriptional regulator n=1 Tax=Candidatus Hadarchaeum sp. TaxID=2883567 RepID=UPI003D0984F7